MVSVTPGQSGERVEKWRPPNSPFGPPVPPVSSMGGETLVPQGKTAEQEKQGNVEREAGPEASTCGGNASKEALLPIYTPPSQQPFPSSPTDPAQSKLPAGAPGKPPTLVKEKKIDINRNSGKIHAPLSQKPVVGNGANNPSSGSSRTIYAPPPGMPPSHRPTSITPIFPLAKTVVTPGAGPSVRVEEVPAGAPPLFRLPELVSVETTGGLGNARFPVTHEEYLETLGAEIIQYVLETFNPTGDPAAPLHSYGHGETRGPGMTKKRLIDGNIHPHPCFRFTPLPDEAEFMDIPPYFLHSGLFEVFNRGGSFTKAEARIVPIADFELYRSDPKDQRDILDYYFCPTCCIWFRVCIDPVTKEDLEAMLGKISHLDTQAVPEAERVEALIRARDAAESVDGEHACHFHKVDKLGSWEPAGCLDDLATGISTMLPQDKREPVNPDFTRSAYMCCGCLHAVFVERLSMPACFPQAIVNELIAREEARDAGKGRSRAADILYTVWQLIRPQICSIGGVEVDGINPLEHAEHGQAAEEILGHDALAGELLRRAGYLMRDQEGHAKLGAQQGWHWRPKVQIVELELSIDNEKWREDIDRTDGNWLCRGWFELQLIIDHLRGNLEVGFGPQKKFERPHRLWKYQKYMESLAMSSCQAWQERDWAPGGSLEGVITIRDLGESQSILLARVTLQLHPTDRLHSIAQQWRAQLQCDPSNTVLYTTAYKVLATASLQAIFEIGEEYDDQPADIHKLLSVMSTYVPDHNSYQTALMTLSLEEAEIKEGGAALVSKTARELINGVDRVGGLSPEVVAIQKACFLDAIKTIALGRQDASLMTVWRRGEQEVNGLSRAFTELKSKDNPNPEQLDEDLWTALFVVQQDDPTKPTSAYFLHWKEPYEVIARAKGFKQLLAATGIEEAEEITAVEDMAPPGLYNIGNTCYLNSLLQYLYSVRPLKEAVMSAAPRTRMAFAVGSVESLRVGGRLVSSREIVRSLQFVSSLAVLFGSMDESTGAAIRPERELAYLALVTAATDVEEPGPTAQTDVTNPPLSTDGVHPSGTTARLTASTHSTELSEGTGRNIEAVVSQAEATDNLSLESSSASMADLPKAGPIDAMDGLTNGSPVKDTVGLPPALMESELESTSVTHSGTGAGEGPVIPTESTAGDSPTDVAMEDVHIGVGGSPPAEPDAQRAIPPPAGHRGSISGPMMFGQQNDVSETLDNCLFQIETAFNALAQQDMAAGLPSDAKLNLIQRLFYGRAEQQVYSGSVDAVLAKQPATDVIFNNIILSINQQDSGDIYDKLHDIYLTRDKIELDGKPAEKAEVLVTCPPLLNIQLQRVSYDRETARAIKSNAAIQFGETIYLDRFILSADRDKRETSELLASEIMENRQSLKSIESDEPMPLDDNLTGLGDALRATGLELEVSTKDLAAEGERVRQVIGTKKAAQSTARKLMEAMWAEKKSFEYELSAVFMHRGQAGYGHYWLYQRDLPAQPDRWFQFNDETVRIVPKAEVLRFIDGDTASAYLLVYVRKGQQTFIETAVSGARRVAEEHREAERAAKAAARLARAPTPPPAAALSPASPPAVQANPTPPSQPAVQANLTAQRKTSSGAVGASLVEQQK